MRYIYAFMYVDVYSASVGTCLSPAASVLQSRPAADMNNPVALLLGLPELCQQRATADTALTARLSQDSTSCRVK